ncbi:LADA_0F11342g1_1 [Lachancea dasiensis]|uniref:LADA_0F11342g1_1 n=1 Tax=Lachancea dasiensis TaxID=1072105 RepID=A0A1G4JM30_9SACH|nr:LADA_0F11342g1_1 [Lachancea dasiensis]
MNDERSQKLLELNNKAWDGELNLPQAGKKLDSSIKRNTGFIRKLKLGISKDSKTSLLKDIEEVSLEKYLSELVVVANEGLGKFSGKSDDIEACVEVMSSLHQRFGYSFTPPLMELFLHNFTTLSIECDSEKEEQLKISRLRAHMRLFTELYLVGLFNSLDRLSKDNLPPFIAKKLGRKEPILFTILKEVLNYRFKTGLTTTVATTFVVKYSQFFSSEPQHEPSLVDQDTSKVLVSLFKAFTEAAISQIMEINKSLNKLLKEHQKAQIRTGKSTDEYIEEYNALLPIFERFETAVAILSNALHLEAPKLERHTEESSSSTTSMITNQQKTSSERVWENEETRKFYEVLPDLAEVVKEVEEKEPADPEKLNDFFVNLELADTKEAIDDLSFRLWTDCLNKKATKRRLLKVFMETTDWSKLRIYARFVASNAESLSDVKDELIQHLDNGFRNQLRSNKINVRNVIFFSEMVKFMLVPSYLIFHKIRTLIMNIQIPNNIEILTILFENFGKFLINNPSHKEQMEKMVDLVQQKKKEHDLTVSNKCALENLIILIYPPSLSKLNAESTELTPEQKFYRILIRKELHTLQPEKIVKLLRRAHWKDANLHKTMVSLFSKPEKVSYQNIDLLAKVLDGLFPYYRNFVILIVDTIVEKVERGSEVNEFNLNMIRIAQVKFLAALCNNNLVKFEVVLEVLYKIIRFGYPGGKPTPFMINEFDMPDSYFRIHLVTTTLLTIRDIPPSKKKQISTFMRFFEYYVLTKEQPLPKETQFKVTECFNALTAGLEFERCYDLIACANELSSCLKIPMAGGTVEGGAEIENDMDDDDEEEEDDDEEDEAEDEDDKDNERESVNDLDSDDGTEANLSTGSYYQDSSDSGDDEDSLEDDDVGGDDDENEDSDEDELEQRRAQEAHMSKLRSEEELKAEEEMEKQFQLLVQESLESRKNEKAFSNNMPMISSGINLDSERESRSMPQAQDTPSKKVAFTFLSKSGKKSQTRTLGLPRNVKFVSGILQEEQKLKAEREKIKNIVMSQSFE